MLSAFWLEGLVFSLTIKKGDPSAVTNRPQTNLEEHEFEAPDAPDIIV